MQVFKVAITDYNSNITHFVVNANNSKVAIITACQTFNKSLIRDVYCETLGAVEIISADNKEY